MYNKNSNAIATVSNIMLEEGTTPTSYETYQSYTKDTVVTKTEDHTLYACWEKN